MMNYIKTKLKEVLEIDDIQIMSSKNKAYDFSTNVCFIKNLDPVYVVQKLSACDFISSCSATGKFIDFNINSLTKLDYLSPKKYKENKQKVNIEFVSANPTGPVHVGHLRGAIFGDVISNLYKHCGYDVIKEFYINDAGGQIDSLMNSIEGYLSGQFDSIEYTGQYVQDLATKHGYNKLNVLNEIINIIKTSLSLVGVTHDVYVKESDIIKNIPQVLSNLKNQSYVYEGKSSKPKTNTGEWNQQSQLIFESTKFGDDTDRPLFKPDGSHTYFMADCAYHQTKIDKKYDKMINVLGIDHFGYAPRIKAYVKTQNQSLDILFVELVNLIKNGQPFTMSKRSGTFVTVDDLVEELSDNVGHDFAKSVIRWMMIAKRQNQVIDFDLDKVVEMSKSNPVFYVNYAYSRAKSTLKLISDQHITPKKLSKIKNNSENKIINMICQQEVIIEKALINHEPHLLTNFLYDLATEFHSYYNNSDEKFYQNDQEHNAMFLIHVIECIDNIMNILGITPMTKM